MHSTLAIVGLFLGIYLGIGFALWAVATVIRAIFELSMLGGLMRAFVHIPEKTTRDKWEEFFVIVFLWLPFCLIDAIKK